jgi:outer membrane receptor protein involved in Fe transport
LPKGDQPFEVHPDGWRGNFFAAVQRRVGRMHFAQTAAWETTRGIQHRFKAGFEFDDVYSQLYFARRDFEIFDSRGLVESAVRFSGPTSTDIRNQEYGVFVQDRMTLSRQFQIELGLRADRESLIDRTNFGPRAAFAYFPLGTERSKISGGAGIFYDTIILENFQLPHLQRRSTADAPEPATVSIAPGLANPHGIHWNLSWDHEWSPRWVTRINTVHKIGLDQVRVGTTANANDLEVNNSGRSRYRSLELSLDRPIRTNLRLLASYVFSTTKARPSLSMDFPDPSLESLPEVPTSWDVRHRFIGWGYFPFFFKTNASFAMEARSGFPYTTVDNLTQAVGVYNGSRFPTYLTVNASFEREVPTLFGKRLAVRVGVLNLFNHFNPRFVDLNVNSSTPNKFSDSSGRGFVARLRVLK